MPRSRATACLLVPGHLARPRHNRHTLTVAFSSYGPSRSRMSRPTATNANTFGLPDVDHVLLQRRTTDADAPWKPVHGFTGTYAASRIAATGANAGTPATPRGRFRRPFRDHEGHLSVELSLDGQRHRRYVHRTVARAYLWECPRRHVVHHRDGSIRRNCGDSLAYAKPWNRRWQASALSTREAGCPERTPSNMATRSSGRPAVRGATLRS